jgi:acyl-CoA dehydrogenase
VAWDFSTDEAFEEQLAWMREFVRDEVAPVEILWPNHHHRVPPPWLKQVIDPLKQQVKDRGLWACHLGPELGGKGFGQVKLSRITARPSRRHATCGRCWTVSCFPRSR